MPRTESLPNTSGPTIHIDEGKAKSSKSEHLDTPAGKPAPSRNAVRKKRKRQLRRQGLYPLEKKVACTNSKRSMVSEATKLATSKQQRPAPRDTAPRPVLQRQPICTPVAVDKLVASATVLAAGQSSSSSDSDEDEDDDMDVDEGDAKVELPQSSAEEDDSSDESEEDSEESEGDEDDEDESPCAPLLSKCKLKQNENLSNSPRVTAHAAPSLLHSNIVAAEGLHKNAASAGANFAAANSAKGPKYHAATEQVLFIKKSKALSSYCIPFQYGLTSYGSTYSLTSYSYNRFEAD